MCTGFLFVTLHEPRTGLWFVVWTSPTSQTGLDLWDLCFGGGGAKGSQSPLSYSCVTAGAESNGIIRNLNGFTRLMQLFISLGSCSHCSVIQAQKMQASSVTDTVQSSDPLCPYPVKGKWNQKAFKCPLSHLYCAVAAEWTKWTQKVLKCKLCNSTGMVLKSS